MVFRNHDGTVNLFKYLYLAVKIENLEIYTWINSLLLRKVSFNLQLTIFVFDL